MNFSMAIVISAFCVTANDRQRDEYALGKQLLQANLPVSAALVWGSIVEAGPSMQSHRDAVASLVALQSDIDDDEIIPSILDEYFDVYGESWSTLPASVVSSINYLVGRRAYRQGRFDQAKQFLLEVTSQSAHFDDAQFLLALTLADPRTTSDDGDDERVKLISAIEILQTLFARYDGVEFQKRRRALIALTLGRLYFGLGNSRSALTWYDKVPNESRHVRQALFERAYAHFQNDDWEAALGSLQALQAPQVWAGFHPEGWILAATIYTMACLYNEAIATIDLFERRFKASEKIPAAQLAGDRIEKLAKLIARMDSELARLKQFGEGDAATAALALSEGLTAQREEIATTLQTVTRRQMADATANLASFRDQSDRIRFEISKAEKQHAESGFDRSAALLGQSLKRPQNFDAKTASWPFEGEFWRDELGWYRYALKHGCPAP